MNGSMNMQRAQHFSTTHTLQKHTFTCTVSHHPSKKHPQFSTVVNATQQTTDRPTSSDSPTTTTPEELLAEQRKYTSLLPPFFSRTTTLEQHGPDLFALVQPLKIPTQPDIKLRMTVARLTNGSLLVVGPVAPTQEALKMLSNLGTTVSHIVIPNTSPEHWAYGPAMAEAFPTATVWTPPGFYTGGGVPFPGRSLIYKSTRERNPQATMGETPITADLEGQFDAVIIDVPLFVEAAVVLPRHKAVCLADTGFKMDAQDPEYAGLGAFNIQMAKMVGVWDRLGPITQIVYERYPTEGKAWVDTLMTKDFDMILPGHASAPVKPGKEALMDCFDFLYV